MNNYLCHVLKSLLAKRRFSIENAPKTNLYSAEELLTFIKWFDEIIVLILESPPNGYVRVVNVIEHKEGHVISIQYDLFQEDEKLRDTELNLIHKVPHNFL